MHICLFHGFETKRSFKFLRDRLVFYSSINLKTGPCFGKEYRHTKAKDHRQDGVRLKQMQFKIRSLWNLYNIQMEIEGAEKSLGVFDIEFDKGIMGVLQQLASEEVLYQIDVALAAGNICTHSLVLTSKHLFLKPKQLCTPLHKSGQAIMCTRLSFQLKFEILYEQQNNPLSCKIGLCLFKTHQMQGNFYSPIPACITQMRSCLNQFLNQRGFHSQFKPVSKLGKGNFATVYQVIRVDDGARLAVKAFSKANSFSSQNGRESLINELEVMREISHKCANLLNLESIYESDNSIYVVMELLKGKTLLDLIKQKNGKFTQPEVMNIMEGLLKGLACLDQNKIMHRDMKPENIMLRNQHYPYDPVIVDFGLATNCDKIPYLFYRCGTPGYVAPEVVKLTQNVKYDPVCDIFSLGCIFHTLMTNCALFPGVKYEQVYKKNKNLEFDLKETLVNNFHPYAMSLLQNMLTPKPEIRIRAGSALKHPFLQGWCQKGAKNMQEEEMSDCFTNIQA